MPAYDLTIAALWTASSRGGKGSNITLIVGIVVPVIVLIIAIAVVVVLVLFSRLRKKVEREPSESRFELRDPLINRDSAPFDGDRYQRYCRIIASSKDEVEDNAPKKSDQSVLTNLYPKDYARLTMKEALAEAGEEDF